MHRYVLMAASVIVGVTVSAQEASAKSSEKNQEKILTQTATSWKNQEGSTMSLTFTPESSSAVYNLSGAYINNAPGFACQGTPYAITGRYYVNTQTLAFDVVWSNSYEDCQSVTGWTGYIDLSVSPMAIVTNWDLAYASVSGQHAIASGSDTFTMTTSVLRPSLMANEE